MRSERTYTAWSTRVRFATLLLAVAVPAWSQTSISISSIQATGSSGPVQGITIGSPVQSFVLTINGSFQSFFESTSVQWTDPLNKVPVFLDPVSITPSQIQVTVPQGLYSTATDAVRVVSITVTQDANVANGQFLLNPPMVMALSPLPAGTTGVPYSQPLLSNGTPPFLIGPVAGSVPGLTIGAGTSNGFIAGTPTAVGVFPFTPTITDQWGNSVSSPLSLQVIAGASVSAVIPNSIPAGSGLLQITVNGVNFTDIQSPSGFSQVQWTMNNVVTLLTTTFVSTTQLTAVVPTALMSAAGLVSISVVQTQVAFSATARLAPGNQRDATVSRISKGNDLASAGVPLTLVAPSIGSLSPSSTVMGGANPLALSIAGANFASRIGAPDVNVGPFQPQVQFGSTILQGAIVNSGLLTVSVPANLLSTPAIIPVRVINPGGSTSAAVNFAVTDNLTIITTALPSGTAGNAYSFRLTATGGVSPIQWAASGLPSALSLNNTTGDLTGIPQTPGSYRIVVTAADATQFSVTANFTLVINPPPLSISSTSLPSGIAGTPYLFRLTATGGVPAYQWSALGLPAALTVNPQTGDISGTPQSPGTFAITLRVTDSVQTQASANVSLVIAPAQVSITTNSIPGGSTGAPYTFRMSASGGVIPYQWTATGLPPGLGINPQTGEIAGIPVAVGTFTPNVRVSDSAQGSATRSYSMTMSAPAPVISTPSTLPNGTVGAPYAALLDISSGASLSFTVIGGHLPDGLTLATNGLISGVPTKVGTFDFLAGATDGQGNSPTKGFTIVIVAGPLVLGDPSATLAVGTPASIGLHVTGGVTPYRFVLGCALPAGLTFGAAGITGTPTTPGTTGCRYTVTDSVGATASKDFTITVVAQSITFTGGPLPPAQVGVSYTAQVTAQGGNPPFTYTGNGLPEGLSVSSTGGISGTPATPGSTSFSVTVTDTNRTAATATFTIVIAPAPLSGGATALPDGVVGIAYSATLPASGGVRPYTWTVTGLPSGIGATAAGVLSGTPDTPGTFGLSGTVKDSTGATATASFTIRIAPAPLVIVTTSIPSGVIGTSYNASLIATGGLTPLTWSATGLPPGVSISSTGVLSGTPVVTATAGIGDFTVAVAARDAAGTTTTKTFTITVSLPPAPALTFGGVGGTSNPFQQPRLTVSIGTAYPVDVVVTLTLTFTPDSGSDDPTIQFSTGGRTARITIPAGSTAGATDLGLQTGTVAGVITIVSQMQAAGVDVTPSPAPRQTVRIAALAPVLTQVTGVRTASGFTLTITGFVTDREATQASFQFNAGTGTNLQTTTLTVPLDSIFAAYFGSAAAAPFGGQFTLTQPFTVSGSVSGIASVSVTLTNKVGASNTITANLN